MKNNAIMTIVLALKEKAPFPNPHPWTHFAIASTSPVHFKVHSDTALTLLVKSSASPATLLRKYFTILAKKVIIRNILLIITIAGSNNQSCE